MATTTNSNFRIMLVGDPGSGKTTAIVSLLKAGYKVFVADFDNNMTSVYNRCPPELLENLHVETLLDQATLDPVSLLPDVAGNPTAFGKFDKLCREWPGHGAPSKWPADHVFIVDPLTGLGRAAMTYSKFANGRGGKRTHPKDYGDMADRLEAVIARFVSWPTNVIVNAHLMRLTPNDMMDEDDDGKGTERSQKKPQFGDLMKRYPHVLGRSLPPRIGAYFPTILYAKRQGTGAGTRYLVSTVPDGDVDVKFPAVPGKIPAEVPNDRFADVCKALVQGQLEAKP